MVTYAALDDTNGQEGLMKVVSITGVNYYSLYEANVNGIENRRQWKILVIYLPFLSIHGVFCKLLQ